MEGKQRMSEQDKEIMELTHEPVKGYPTALYAVVTIAAFYLAVIFISSV